MKNARKDPESFMIAAIVLYDTHEVGSIENGSVKWLKVQYNSCYYFVARRLLKTIYVINEGKIRPRIRSVLLCFE